MQIQCKTFKGPDFLSCCLSLANASVLQFFEILLGLHSKSLRLLVCKCKNFSGLTQLYSGFQVYFGTSWCDDSKHGLWKQKIHSPWQYTTAYLCAVGCCVGQAGQGSRQTQDHCWSPAMALQWPCESTRSLTLAAAFWPLGPGGEGWASVQSELTQGDCTSLQQDWRVVLQIYEVQGTSGSKVQCTAAESLSTVQHCWLQSC